MRYAKPIWPYALIVFLPGSLRVADTVHMTTGGFVKNCRVIKKDAGILHVRTPSGRMGIPLQFVKRIASAKSVFDDYDERKSALRDGNTDGLFRLALWCKKTPGLRLEMHELLEAVIAKKKDHLQARQLLAHIRTGTKWTKTTPLALTLAVEDGSEHRSVLKDQLSLTLEPRPKLRWNGSSKKTLAATDLCQLDVSTKLVTSSDVRFFGQRVRGKVTRAWVKITASASWLGRDNKIEKTLIGEVPATVPNAAQQALIDAFNRSPNTIHTFYDELIESRRRVLQAMAAKPASG